MHKTNPTKQNTLPSSLIFLKTIFTRLYFYKYSYIALCDFVVFIMGRVFFEMILLALVLVCLQVFENFHIAYMRSFLATVFHTND